jgi:hypothetical protein
VEPISFIVQLNVETFIFPCDIMYGYYNVTCFVATPLWGKCEDETHIPESGNLESSEIPATLELDCRGQNTSP